MSITHEIDAAAGLLRVVNRGLNGLREVLAVAEAINRDPRLRPGFCELNDVRGGDFRVEERGEIDTALALQRRDLERRGIIRLALLCRDDGQAALVAAGLAAAGLPDGTARVFLDEDAALAWLGVMQTRPIVRPR